MSSNVNLDNYFIVGAIKCFRANIKSSVIVKQLPAENWQPYASDLYLIDNRTFLYLPDAEHVCEILD